MEEMAQIMAGVVVWHTEARMDLDQITYFAECDDFDPIHDAVVATPYDLIVHTENGAFVRREFRKITPQQ